MVVIDQSILAGILELMSELQDDWEYTGDIGPEARLFSDLGLGSLDLVVLGTMIQKRYGRVPFADFLAEIGQRPAEERDLTVGELVAFVSRYRGWTPTGEVR